MKVILDGQIWENDDWADCPVEVAAFDGKVEITLMRKGYDDERILICQAELAYAIKAIELAPDYSNEGGAE